MEVERIKWQVKRNLHLQPVNHRNELMNILEEVFEAMGYKAYFDKDGNKIDVPRQIADKVLFEYFDASAINEENIIDSINDIKVYADGYQLKMKYCPIKTAIECHKEIDLRTGSYDPKEGKWCKQPQSQTYKADYSTCKITSEEIEKYK